MAEAPRLDGATQQQPATRSMKECVYSVTTFTGPVEAQGNDVSGRPHYAGGGIPNEEDDDGQ